MAKGQLAKEQVVKIISQAFGDDYIGEFDKKHYVWANDGNEKVQISIALTCPKVYRGIEEGKPSTLNFNIDNNQPNEGNQPSHFEPAQISQEEKDTLQDLILKLGL